ncbi:MAG: protein kinase [Cyanobacteria bacterium SZAS TMP-1]|nr:protein kinase [Cyanobacteria bacterium SZAS TMP-1]
MDFKPESKKKNPELVEQTGGSDASAIMPGYEILEKLGEDSLTIVYKVRKIGVVELFVAKVLRPEFAGNPRTAKRFMQEGQKAMGLNNPHLLSVYDVGRCGDGVPFVVCQLVDGETLADRLRREPGKMSSADILEIVQQLAEGLGEAHKKGVLHRDIKPAGIVFTRGKNGAAGLVKLADFGISKALPGAGRETRYLTPEGEEFGNPTYMSPEQLMGERLGPVSDIYSLGCVLYECIRGRPPFVGGGTLDVARQKLHDEPEDLNDVLRGQDGVAAGINSIVMRMLKRSSQERYQSVDELLAAFNAVQSGKKAPVAVAVKESASAFLFKPLLLIGLIFCVLNGFLALAYFNGFFTRFSVPTGPIRSVQRPLIDSFSRSAANKFVYYSLTPGGTDNSGKVFADPVKNVDGKTLFYCHAQQADLAANSAYKDGVSLKGLDLASCGSGPYGLYLEGADLRGANFSDCRLHGGSLKNADLRGADFSHVKVRSALQMHAAKLKGINVTGADMKNVMMFREDLSEVDWKDALRPVVLDNRSYEG